MKQNSQILKLKYIGFFSFDLTNDGLLLNKSYLKVKEYLMGTGNLLTIKPGSLRYCRHLHFQQLMKCKLP